MMIVFYMVDSDSSIDKVKKHLEDSGVSIKDYELVNKDITNYFKENCLYRTEKS